jgi:hypothetical protein
MDLMVLGNNGRTEHRYLGVWLLLQQKSQNDGERAREEESRFKHPHASLMYLNRTVDPSQHIGHVLLIRKHASSFSGGMHPFGE